MWVPCVVPAIFLGLSMIANRTPFYSQHEHCLHISTVTNQTSTLFCLKFGTIKVLSTDKFWLGHQGAQTEWALGGPSPDMRHC
jgi:hypothetical protein